MRTGYTCALIGSQDIPTELLDNEEQFKHPFFKRFELRHAAAPLDLGRGIYKNYLFPALYGDASCAIAIFHCDYEAVRAQIPDARIEPVKMSRGRSLVVFSCYEYRTVRGIRPYNEIAVAIPVVKKGSLNLPVLTMLLADRLSGFGFHVLHMPVTSEENRIRGVKIWGLPKALERIDIEVRNGLSLTEAYDESESPYFRLRVPVDGTKTHFDLRSSLFSYLGGELLRSTTEFEGDYKVHKAMKTLYRRGLRPQSPCLELGEGGMADRLRALKIEAQPLEFRYAAHMNASFDLPA